VYPELARIGPVRIGTHDVWVALGLIVAGGVFAAEWRRRRRNGETQWDDRLWYVLTGALLGGALLERLGTWATHLDPRRNADLATQWVYGNRSILSGLVGAYAGALLAKRLAGYGRGEHTGDLFAPAVAAGMAVGRVGCLLTELPGIPTSLPWGITLSPAEAARIPHAVAGVPLHPSFGYEIVFHLAALTALCWLRDRLPRPGELFKLYVGGYALFRFGVEFVRGNEVVWAGLTRAQLFLVACAPLLVAHLWRQARRGTYAALWRRPPADRPVEPMYPKEVRS
jgi:prolipoprotein diacylglyceryltransferase